jgi:hypothetical protein
MKLPVNNFAPEGTEEAEDAVDWLDSTDWRLGWDVRRGRSGLDWMPEEAPVDTRMPGGLCVLQ